MTCERCGKILEPGEKFCPVCGKQAETPAPMYGMQCTQNDRPGAQTEPVYKAPAQEASTTAQYKAPAEIAAPEKEKEYFGKGALALCLVVIGLLAASTGVFAYLYFSLVGML